MESEFLVFHWKHLSDDQSGLSAASWCAGATKTSCDLVPWLPLPVEKQFVHYKLSVPLRSGSSVYVTIQGRNGAGQNSNSTSQLLVIDTTPPSTGFVRVGKKQQVQYFQQNEHVTVTWGGIRDMESGINRYQWKLCYSSWKSKCISQYASVGTRSSLKLTNLALTPGVFYVIVVKADNKVGLYKEMISNVFAMDSSAPVPQQVYLDSGSQFQSSTVEVSAKWLPFLDPESGITEYQVCLGTKQYSCDVKEFQSFGKRLQANITGLDLNHTDSYHITVRAFNGAGLFVVSSSESVTMDTTPPLEARVRDGETSQDIDIQWDDSIIAANWDEFSDPESDIIKYLWCAGTQTGVCDVVPQTDVGKSLRVQKAMSPTMPSGLTVYITVIAVNGAGAESQGYSDGMTIDTTPPLATKASRMLTINQS